MPQSSQIALSALILFSIFAVFLIFTTISGISFHTYAYLTRKPNTAGWQRKSKKGTTGQLPRIGTTEIDLELDASVSQNVSSIASQSSISSSGIGSTRKVRRLSAESDSINISEIQREDVHHYAKAINSIRKTFRNDIRCRQGFFSSKRPAIRYFVIGLQARHVTNTLALIYVLMTILYVLPYAMQDQSWNENQTLCGTRIYSIIVASSLSYSGFIVFYNIRAWALINNPKLVQNIEANVQTYKNCIKISVFITFFKTIFLLPMLMFSATPHLDTVDNEIVCIADYSMNAVYFLGNAVQLVLNFVSLGLTVGTYIYMLRDIKKALKSTGNRNKTANDASEAKKQSQFEKITETVKRITLWTLICFITTLVSFSAIVFCPVSRFGLCVTFTTVNIDIICNVLCAALSYKDTSVWMFPYFAICKCGDDFVL